MDNEQLQKLVEKISITYFNKQFLHTAVFNPRLRTTGGRYLLSTGNIEINKKHLDIYGEEELIGIIKHELCHYHLHQNNMGYRHGDRDFKLLAEKVGAPRYCTPLPEQQKPRLRTFHYYQCKKCQFLYRRQRRVDTRKFVCGKCGGKLLKVNK